MSVLRNDSKSDGTPKECLGSFCVHFYLKMTTDVCAADGSLSGSLKESHFQMIYEEGLFTF